MKKWEITRQVAKALTAREQEFMLVATVRSIKIGRIASSTSLQTSESRMELNTHADTTVLGKNCLLIQDFGKSF